MLNQINGSDLLVALSDQQQEIVTGGADFELAASNYANKGSLLMGTSVSVLKVAAPPPQVRLILS